MYILVRCHLIKFIPKISKLLYLLLANMTISNVLSNYYHNHKNYALNILKIRKYPVPVQLVGCMLHRHIDTRRGQLQHRFRSLKEDRYEEEAYTYSRNEEGQHVFQPFTLRSTRWPSSLRLEASSKYLANDLRGYILNFCCS